MDYTSLNEVSSLINKQIDFQERVGGCLCELEALLAVAVSTQGFYDLQPKHLHHYFSVVSDLIEESKAVNQDGLSNLYR